MKHTNVLPLILVTALTFVSCAKDTAEIAQDVGLLPSGCGGEGARLQATISGSSFCATAQLFAVGDESSVIVSGVDLAGNTLVMNVDTVGVGTHAMTEAENSMLFMQAGTSFVSGPNDVGTLIIQLHDTTTRRLKGTFTTTLTNGTDNSTRQVEGQFDVSYNIGG